MFGKLRRLVLQVLLTLPAAARQDYFPLLAEPMLMLEQLLMNLKVEWAEVAVQTLRSLLIVEEAGFNAEDVDKLLADYACKALDFSCAPRERTRSGQYRVGDTHALTFSFLLNNFFTFGLKQGKIFCVPKQ